MSKIRSLNSNIKNIINEITQINNHTYVLVTIDPTLIVNSRIKLPYPPVGDVIHDMSLIYNAPTGSRIMYEVTCIAEDDYVIYDPDDNVEGKYGVVSYLAIVKATDDTVE